MGLDSSLDGKVEGRVEFARVCRLRERKRERVCVRESGGRRGRRRSDGEGRKGNKGEHAFACMHASPFLESKWPRIRPLMEHRYFLNVLVQLFPKLRHRNKKVM